MNVFQVGLPEKATALKAGLERRMGDRGNLGYLSSPFFFFFKEFMDYYTFTVGLHAQFNVFMYSVAGMYFKEFILFVKKLSGPRYILPTQYSSVKIIASAKCLKNKNYLYFHT